MDPRGSGRAPPERRYYRGLLSIAGRLKSRSDSGSPSEHMERRCSNKIVNIDQSGPRAWHSRTVCSCRSLRTHGRAHSLFVSSADHRADRSCRRPATTRLLRPFPFRPPEQKSEIACIQWPGRYARHRAPRLSQYDSARTALSDRRGRAQARRRTIPAADALCRLSTSMMNPSSPSPLRIPRT